jgi:hypothetical protein
VRSNPIRAPATSAALVRDTLRDFARAITGRLAAVEHELAGVRLQ